MCARRATFESTRTCASHSEFQDDIEEAFVVKQILQHLATKHGLNFHEVAFQEENDVLHVMTLKDIAHVGKFGCKLLCSI